ncbi:LysM peptidoglycan-binding domain-containing protein [Alkaliphilus transvaalensis]|uniref:LysM peptidoglycan-binding domain-containing protein n=1 Tax=Alkaliphilus transvaalensis TaxID=114628 RepID=UPI00047C8468|nr:LysM peptidoglycan-binding domain-containing protein [Alkaliphilus transvaalensis]
MKKNIKKIIVGTTLAATLFTSTAGFTFANQAHTVRSGDTLWKIAQQYNTSLERIYQLNPNYRANPNLWVGATVMVPSSGQLTNYTVVRNDTPWLISNRLGVSLSELLKVNGLTASSQIYPGQILKIPSTTSAQTQQYRVERNDTPWIISQKFNVNLQQLLDLNNLKAGQHIYEGQILLIPNTSSNNSSSNNSSSNNSNNNNQGNQSSSGVTKTFTTHTVANGDDLWNLSIKYGIPFAELKQVNGLTDNSVLRIGQKLTIPVYQVPVKPTPGPRFGELLDWWTEAQYVVPIGKIFTIIDFQTGRSWQAKRTIGANHADTEPLTARDANIMKEVWGGNFSWATRAVIVEVDGRRIAASASSLPHDIQYITNNSFNGHFDLYFLNSTRHVDGRSDANHQANVLRAGGK